MTRRLITASLISLCAFLLLAHASFAAPMPDIGQTKLMGTVVPISSSPVSN